MDPDLAACRKATFLWRPGFLSVGMGLLALALPEPSSAKLDACPPRSERLRSAVDGAEDRAALIAELREIERLIPPNAAGIRESWRELLVQGRTRVQDVLETIRKRRETVATDLEGLASRATTPAADARLLRHSAERLRETNLKQAEQVSLLPQRLRKIEGSIQEAEKQAWHAEQMAARARKKAQKAGGAHRKRVEELEQRELERERLRAESARLQEPFTPKNEAQSQFIHGYVSDIRGELGELRAALGTPGVHQRGLRLGRFSDPPTRAERLFNAAFEQRLQSLRSGQADLPYLRQTYPSIFTARGKDRNLAQVEAYIRTKEVDLVRELPDGGWTWVEVKNRGPNARLGVDQLRSLAELRDFLGAEARVELEYLNPRGLAPGDRERIEALGFRILEQD